jgi:putative DNA primase/helicase
MNSGAIDWHGSSRQPCPACDRGPRDRALGVTRNDDGSFVARCFRCDFVELLRDAARITRTGTPTVRPAQVKHETLSNFGRELWAACRALAGEARAYLEHRRCVIPPRDGDLRWHPSLKHPPSGTIGPALVGLVTHAVTAQPLTLHRTWIRADGNKAALDPPRMLLGGHRKAGGVVRLWADEAVSVGLGVAEGIESALSLAHAYQPVWACIDAGNLAAFPVLPGIESLLVAADHDEAGISAARLCAQRWANAEREVAIAMPPTPKSDLNDLARRAA